MASKRARSSLSSGPDAGAGGLAAAFERSGEISNDARASMALADLIHSEGLFGDFGNPAAICVDNFWQAAGRLFSNEQHQDQLKPALALALACRKR